MTAPHGTPSVHAHSTARTHESFSTSWHGDTRGASLSLSFARTAGGPVSSADRMCPSVSLPYVVDAQVQG